MLKFTTRLALMVGLLIGCNDIGRCGGQATALEGTWIFTVVGREGKLEPKEKFDLLRFVVNGNEYKLMKGAKELESGSLRLGKDSLFDTIDRTVVAGRDSGKVRHGIFRVSGETASVAYLDVAQTGRPSELSNKLGQIYSEMQKLPDVATASAVASRWSQASPSPHSVAPSAGIDLQDASGKSSLHRASLCGDVNEVRRLLSLGAKVDNRSPVGTPLYYAVDEGHLEVVRLLIEHGADVNLPNGIGDYPLDTALSNLATMFGDENKRKYSAVVELLKSHGAKNKPKK